MLHTNIFTHKIYSIKDLEFNPVIVEELDRLEGHRRGKAIIFLFS